MLKNLCALAFLALVVSPFTEPFQTLDPSAGDHQGVIITPINGVDDSGSLVEPLVKKAGRLTVATPEGLVISSFVPTVFLISFIPPSRHARYDATRPTVLRL